MRERTPVTSRIRPIKTTNDFSACKITCKSSAAATYGSVKLDNDFSRPGQINLFRFPGLPAVSRKDAKEAKALLFLVCVLLRSNQSVIASSAAAENKKLTP